ncbi:MAG: SDR family oxidoreductase [Alphaproteobacteria bacterium]
MSTLKGKTVFVTGASRGIGAEIAKRAARDGANVVLAAKTVEPHPKLPGTLPEVAAECEALGGEALPVQMDLRHVEQIEAAAEAAVEAFGGIDILVNNASVQTFTKTPDTTPKQFDLLFDINARGTFFMTQACLPSLRQAANPHILTIASPLNPDPRWFAERLPRTMSKYAMSMLTMGWAEEFREEGIASTGLWPRHSVATMAVKIFNPESYEGCRDPAIMADAAQWIITQPAMDVTGRFFLDDEALSEKGLPKAEIDAYWIHPTKRSRTSSFLDYDARNPESSL